MNDYESHDGIGLAELVRGGQVSAGELLGAALARMERRNPQLNAVVTPLHEAAALAPHPLAEAVGPLATLVVGLEGALRHGSLLGDSVTVKNRSTP